MKKHKVLKIFIILIILILFLPIIYSSIWDPFSLSNLKNTFVTYTNWKFNVNGSGFELEVDTISVTNIIAQIGNIINIRNDINMQKNNIDNVSNTTSDYFYGIYDWIIKSGDSRRYLEFNGTDLLYNETELNKTIDAKLTGKTWVPVVNYTQYGTVQDGNITYIQIYPDNQAFNITEVVPNAILYYFNTTNNVSLEVNKMEIRYKFTGSDTLTLSLQKTDLSWESYILIEQSVDFIWKSAVIKDALDHIIEGKLVGKIEHTGTAKLAHKLSIDQITASSSFAPSPPAVIPAIHTDGSNSPIANIDWDDNSIYNASYVNGSNFYKNGNPINSTSELLPTCAGGEFTTSDGTDLTCDTPAGGGGAGDKWLDNDDWISPNTTFASIVNATKFTADLGVNITKGGIKGTSGASINASYFYDDGSLLIDTIALVNVSFGLIVGFTANEYSGNISNSSDIGYIRANAICDEEFSGSRFCLEAEIVRTFIKNQTITGTYWMSRGAPGYTANADDCAGWDDNSTTYLGPFWNWDANLGVGAGRLTNCAQRKKLMCCK